LLAAGELETRDFRAPVKRAVHLEVLVRVPERAVVHGIDGHGAVIAPSTEPCELRTAARLNNGLRLHCAQRIGREPPGVPDRRENTAAGRAVAQRNIPLLVHGDAPHPAVSSIRRSERPLLINAWGPIRIPQLVPADRSDL